MPVTQAAWFFERGSEGNQEMDQDHTESRDTKDSSGREEYIVQMEAAQMYGTYRHWLGSLEKEYKWLQRRRGRQDRADASRSRLIGDGTRRNPYGWAKYEEPQRLATGENMKAEVKKLRESLVSMEEEYRHGMWLAENTPSYRCQNCNMLNEEQGA